jgi:hypothetical protein
VTTRFARCGIALAAIASFGLGAPAASARGGAFDILAGYWSGGGRVQLSDGSSEPIRCRASYAIGGGGNLMQQKLTCASASYKFDISSNVEENGGRLSGSWSESTRGVNGQVEGVVRGGQISARVAAGGFNAALSVSTRGAAQSVLITPQGSDIRAVSVSMRKR